MTLGRRDTLRAFSGNTRPIDFSRPGRYVVFAFGVAAVLFLNGAVPFAGMPSLGTVVWLSGFAQSMANGHALTIYAENVGVPSSAPISFGLSVAYPISHLIRLGLHSADAYSVVVAVWLIIAFYGSWKLILWFAPGSYCVSALGALLWCANPFVLVHAGFSAVSIGMALMPFYLWMLLRLYPEYRSNNLRFQNAIAFVAVCIVSVFMDGYTFVMFLVGSSFIGLYLFLRLAKDRVSLVCYAFPIQAAGFILAYIFYFQYIGRFGFESEPIEFFRGWGLDLSFLVAPSEGQHWIWDFFGLSVVRSASEWYGAAPVWTSSFAGPLIFAGLLTWWSLRRKCVYANAFLIIAIFGTYMALGPSLKVLSKKSPSLEESSRAVQLMPAAMALAPTGSAWLSENVPGFRNMRAAYRWLVLGLCGFWLLIVLGIGRLQYFRGKRIRAVIYLLVLIILYLPHPMDQWRAYSANRSGFKMIDAELVSDFGEVLKQGERVAFLPYRNDFLVNYLAARLQIHTYNIGGDKNLAEARRHWPATMRQFPMARVDAEFVDRVHLLLARREADAVVLPYIDMLWAAHAWPAPRVFMNEMEPVVAELMESQFVTLEERRHYAIVRLATEFLRPLRSGELEHLVASSRCLAPVCLKAGEVELAASPRQVGRLENGRLESDGRKGFLLFGPYAPMDAGRYRLIVLGRAARVGLSWADVVSERGRVVHARSALSETPRGEDGVVADEPVTFDTSVSDLEVRIYVGEEDELQITGYRLAPQDDMWSPAENRP